MTRIVYRDLRPGEEEAVCAMVAASFAEFVAPDYSPEGVAEFLRYAAPAALAERQRAGHFTLVAEAAGAPVGMIELRHDEHVALLFVDGRHHRRGIAGRLFRRALVKARESRPDVARVTVHSSRHAIPVYEALGFRATGREETVHGMIFIPMGLDLTAEPHAVP